MPSSLQKAADYAASLIRDGVDFRSAVTQASRRSGVEWLDIQHELTFRSLQMRAPRRPPEAPPEPAPEEPPEPEADQGKFGFMDETRRVIRNILFETNGAGTGSGGTGGGAAGAGGATGSGAASSGAGGTGNGTGGDSGGNGGTNMDGGDGEPDSTTMMPMKAIHLGRRFGIGYPYYPRKKGCKYGRRKDGKCRKAPKKEAREIMRGILGKSQTITLLVEGVESDAAVAQHPAVREWADLPERPKVLGVGSFGTVFETNNPNVVLKISSDYEEFQAVSRLLDDNASLTNVVEIYEAAVVNMGTKIDEKYAILEERLIDLEDAGVNKGLVENFSAALHYYTADKAGKLPRRGNFHTVMNHYWETNEVERFQRWLQQTPPHPEPVEYEKGIDDLEYEQDSEWWEEEKQNKREWAAMFGEDGPGEGIANDIIEGLEQLQSHGIKYGDIHSGNIMVHPKDGQFKITDIGISDTSGKIELRPELALQGNEAPE